jgi:hypothetical protein
MFVFFILPDAAVSFLLFAVLLFSELAASVGTLGEDRLLGDDES